MNGGLWFSSVKNNIFSVMPYVPLFLDVSYQYYMKLYYYKSDNSPLNIVGFNNTVIDNIPITTKIADYNGILSIKVNKLDNPFFSFIIIGKLSEHIVFKNLEIYYLEKKKSCRTDNLIESSNLVVKGKLTVIE